MISPHDSGSRLQLTAPLVHCASSFTAIQLINTFPPIISLSGRPAGCFNAARRNEITPQAIHQTTLWPSPKRDPPILRIDHQGGVETECCRFGNRNPPQTPPLGGKTSACATLHNISPTAASPTATEGRRGSIQRAQARVGKF